MTGIDVEANFTCWADRLAMQLRKAPREANWIWWLLANLPKLRKEEVMRRDDFLFGTCPK